MVKTPEASWRAVSSYPFSASESLCSLRTAADRSSTSKQQGPTKLNVPRGKKIVRHAYKIIGEILRDVIKIAVYFPFLLRCCCGRAAGRAGETDQPSLGHGHTLKTAIELRRVYSML